MQIAICGVAKCNPEKSFNRFKLCPVNTLNENIRKLRRLLDLTQENMAACLKISRQAYSKKECGKNNFTSRQLRDVAAELKTTVRKLKDGSCFHHLPQPPAGETPPAAEAVRQYQKTIAAQEKTIAAQAETISVQKTAISEKDRAICRLRKEVRSLRNKVLHRKAAWRSRQSLVSLGNKHIAAFVQLRLQKPGEFHLADDIPGRRTGKAL